MADIFKSFPSSGSQGGKTKSGLVGPSMGSKRDVMGYQTPYGIRGQTTGPGLGQDNYGNCGSQGGGARSATTSGGPGLGGKNRSNSPTQRG